MSSPNDTPATPTGADPKVGFFDLPRELRDEIYDLALEHDRTSGEYWGHPPFLPCDHGTMHLYVRAPESRLRLVSRQFALEYYERSPSEDDICLSVTGSSPTKHLQSAGGFPYAARAPALDNTLTSDPFDHSLYSYIDPLCSWLFELVTDTPYIKTLHLQLCFNIPPNLNAFDWLSRTAHRAIRYVAPKFDCLQREMRNTKPIISVDKIDVMVVMPKVDSDSAYSAGSRLGKWVRGRLITLVVIKWMSALLKCAASTAVRECWSVARGRREQNGKIGDISAWCKWLTATHSRCMTCRIVGSTAKQAIEARMR
jgi:hypothetical protein